jgi:hypothetical protein
MKYNWRMSKKCEVRPSKICEGWCVVYDAALVEEVGCVSDLSEEFL